MREIEIRWTSKKDHLEVPSKHREYSVIQIQFVNECSEKLKKFVKTFAGSISEIRILECNFKMSEVHLLLSMVSLTLENLEFIKSPLLEQKILPKIEMLKLKDLIFNECTPSKKCDVPAFVSMISTPILQSFWYGDFATENEQQTLEEATVMVDFLYQSVADAVIEHWLTTKESNIDLRLLKIDYAGALMPSSHWKFIKSQQSSLRCLMIEKADMEHHDLHKLLSLELRQLQLNDCELKCEKKIEIENDSIWVLKLSLANEPATENSFEAVVHLISSCTVVKHISIAFPAYDNALKPVLTAIANKRSLFCLTIHNPFIVNATAFPYVAKFNIYAGSDPEVEVNEVIRLLLEYKNNDSFEEMLEFFDLVFTYMRYIGN